MLLNIKRIIRSLYKDFFVAIIKNYRKYEGNFELIFQESFDLND
jgi:hypothetical protein